MATINISVYSASEVSNVMQTSELLD